MSYLGVAYHRPLVPSLGSTPLDYAVYIVFNIHPYRMILSCKKQRLYNIIRFNIEDIDSADGFLVSLLSKQGTRNRPLSPFHRERANEENETDPCVVDDFSHDTYGFTGKCFC